MIKDTMTLSQSEKTKTFILNHCTLTRPIKIYTNIKQKMYLQSNLKVVYIQFIFFNFLALRSVSSTIARLTTWWNKIVDKVGSTVFHLNTYAFFATSRASTKADLPVNFTIFHCRMSTIQPTWPVCATSECWHTRYWHFCPCSFHKTIPSLR